MDVENKFIEHDSAARRARCSFARARNRLQPQTNLWNYENTMLIKIIAMFRNLLISSFDTTIPVKRAFHPAVALRGLASHVFVVNKFKASCWLAVGFFLVLIFRLTLLIISNSFNQLTKVSFVMSFVTKDALWFVWFPVMFRTC